MAHAHQHIAPNTDKANRPQPALRLVKTQDLNREEWLTVRKGGIGSSDAASAIGLNPYKSQLELWMEKTGRDANLPKVDPKDQSSPMYWGTLLESIVAAHYTMRSGINGARLWKEGVPEYVQLQVMHQLAVTGKQTADVAVLICGQELQIHRIERDAGMIAKLVELERQFWHYVETDTPPPADGSDSADVALRCLYPKDNGSTLDLSQDLEMSAAFSDLLAVRQLLTQNTDLESQLKQRIQQRLGDATKAVFETGDVTWKRSKDGSGLDVAQLLKDQPDLLQRYALTKPGSRRFLVNT
jgi:predicted phage-related endonuclease